MDRNKESEMDKYECTLCGKTHRQSQQSRGFGTDRYSMHFEWRKGGPQDIEDDTRANPDFYGPVTSDEGDFGGA
jgi:hypothetical protein